MTEQNQAALDLAVAPKAAQTRRAFIERLALTTAAPVVLPLLLTHPRSEALAY